jgi:tRNA1Val (adenine37-N6)-methyltransferase
MIAQRFKEAQITAIDINPAAVEISKQNVEHSIFKDQINIKHLNFNELNENNFDFIFSNPPFFVPNPQTPMEDRALARQTRSLTPESIFKGAYEATHEKGGLAIIIPFPEKKWLSIAEQFGWHLHRRTKIASFEERDPIRQLLYWTKTKQLKVKEDHFYLYEENKKRSVAYSLLTQDFYL